MKCILPCSGFGVRMGMSPNESKEMLQDLIYYKQRIIDYTLNICKRNLIPPLVITRDEKQDLITYLKDLNIAYKTIIVEGEWMDTVLKSKDDWDEFNLLLLPDTRWYNDLPLEDIQLQLKMGCNAIIGVHKVSDPEKWGVIDNYSIIEKPTNLNGPQYAWGVIAFRKEYGEKLFGSMKVKQPFKLENVGFFELVNFKDITREGQ